MCFQCSTLYWFLYWVPDYVTEGVEEDLQREQSLMAMSKSQRGHSQMGWEGCRAVWEPQWWLTECLLIVVKYMLRLCSLNVNSWLRAVHLWHPWQSTNYRKAILSCRKLFLIGPGSAQGLQCECEGFAAWVTGCSCEWPGFHSWGYWVFQRECVSCYRKANRNFIIT